MITTRLYDVDYVHLGPLTTTYTAPASCATLTDLRVAPTDIPYIPYWYETCTLQRPPFGDCFPSGSSIDDRVRSEPPDRRHSWVAYHSPGSACPASWTTAGVVTKNDDGTTTGASGIFTASEFPGPEGTPLPTPQLVPYVHLVAEGLEAGETGVLCCPSGYEGSPYGGCVSNYDVELYTATTGCLVYAPYGGDYSNFTMTYNGEVVTGTEYKITATGERTTTSTDVTTFNDTEMTAWVGVTNMPMVVLVDTGSRATESDEGEPTESGNAAAGGGMPGAGGLMVLLGVWGVAVLAGAGVFAVM